MNRVSVSIGAILLSLATLPMRAGAQEPPKSHRDLDWQAPRRWVHVDNVDAQKASLFVDARLSWLAKLRTDDGLLADGRPLFWHARSSKAGETFFSFYPFRTWTDLDARGQMATETVKVVGEDALKAYDSGDEALVSPHYSQIWSRVAEYDIAVPATESLTELSATAGRLEVHSVDITRWERLRAVVEADHGRACRRRVPPGLPRLQEHLREGRVHDLVVGAGLRRVHERPIDPGCSRRATRPAEERGTPRGPRCGLPRRGVL